MFYVDGVEVDNCVNCVNSKAKEKGEDVNITEELLSCSACNTTKSQQQKESLLLHAIPDLPWSIAATDMFECHGKQYQALVDSYSGWFEIDLLCDIINRDLQIEETLLCPWYTTHPVL